MNSEPQTANSRWWKPWLDAALAFVYPNVCQICLEHRAIPEQGYVCLTCRAHRKEGVRWLEPPFCQRCGLPFAGAITSAFECSNCRESELHFDFARGSVRATKLVLDCVHRYKYARAWWVEPFLIELLQHSAVPALADQKWDAIVPVPLHPLKLREREFNQAERLARHLAKATGIRLNARALQRVQYTETQTALNQTQRAENMKNAFTVRRGTELRGQRILLVDDVLTTGATASACAEPLRKAGAAAVGVWTVARAIFK